MMGMGMERGEKDGRELKEDKRLKKSAVSC